jgi:hypothetical protein
VVRILMQEANRLVYLATEAHIVIVQARDHYGRGALGSDACRGS